MSLLHIRLTRFRSCIRSLNTRQTLRDTTMMSEASGHCRNNSPFAARPFDIEINHESITMESLTSGNQTPQIVVNTTSPPGSVSLLVPVPFQFFHYPWQARRSPLYRTWFPVTALSDCLENHLISKSVQGTGGIYGMSVCPLHPRVCLPWRHWQLSFSSRLPTMTFWSGKFEEYSVLSERWIGCLFMLQCSPLTNWKPRLIALERRISIRDGLHVNSFIMYTANNDRIKRRERSLPRLI